MEMDESSIKRMHGPSWNRFVTALLTCGVIVAPVQIVGDVIAAALYPGYSYANQAVSELSAIGAPTRAFLTNVGFLYEALILAFAFGVWKTAGGKRSLRIAAGLLGLFALNAFIWTFFPMQQRGSELAATDVGHIIGAIAQVLTIVLFISFGSMAHGRKFRIFSFLMIAAVLASGSVMATQSSRIGAGLPTPGAGLFERISFYGPSIWILTLAVVLLRTRYQGEVLPRSASARSGAAGQP
jgi:hypothetical membrane protein